MPCSSRICSSRSSECFFDRRLLCRLLDGNQNISQKVTAFLRDFIHGKRKDIRRRILLSIFTIIPSHLAIVQKHERHLGFRENTPLYFLQSGPDRGGKTPHGARFN